MLKQHSVINAPVSTGSFHQVSGEVFQLSKAGKHAYVCVANVHMLTFARSNARLSEVMEKASIVTTDGMPLVWALKLQGIKSAERVAGPDLMIRLCQLAQEESIPVYFFGGSSETINQLKTNVTKQFPHLCLAGFEAPPMLPHHPSVDKEVVERIQASGARIVFVGLGCPKQEYWMAEYAPHLKAVLLGVGAAFDFIAGTRRRAPVWMQRAGLEWLFRLSSEPKRLWKRYLYSNALFYWYFLKDFLTKPDSTKEKR